MTDMPSKTPNATRRMAARARALRRRYPALSAPQKPGPAEKNVSGKKNAGQSGSVEMEKIVNDLAANIRSIAQNRGRNAKVAEEMVPNPPASETAADRAPSLIPIMPPKRMGCSIPKRSHIGVCIRFVLLIMAVLQSVGRASLGGCRDAYVHILVMKLDRGA